MANLKAIRKRINSVKSTQQITKAMKMVAAAKLRKAQDALLNGRPYALHLIKTISRLASKIEESSHPLLRQPREDGDTLLLIITSDRGLCGAFNANINRTAEHFIRQHLDKKTQGKLHLAFIGRKGREYFSRRSEQYGTPIDYNFTGVFDDLTIERTNDIIHTLIQDFTSEKYDKIYLIYNEFKSAIAQRVLVEHLFPIATLPDDEDSELENSSENSEHLIQEYLYEPELEHLLNHLLPLHLSTHLFRALKESFASEMGARMTAMEAATNNASDLIAQLTLDFNRARQAAITTELIEIISGAEAL